MTSSHPPSSKGDILQFLVKQTPATAQQLAEHLKISPQATRRHLKDLESEGLVEHNVMQTGMGRPQYLYHLSEKGREQLPAQYDDFALSLLDTIAETFGPDQVGTILQKQWVQKGLDYRDRIGNGPLQERVEKLVELRQDEGYMAEWHLLTPDELTQYPSSHPRFVITEYNCAISHVAQSYPRVCDHELEMFERALQDCSVERTHWQVKGEHRCGYLVRRQSHRS
ncbi:MAG: iron-sulfur cluster biosynthesis transcriptional regulator SufR [Merismopedia sp. SIO2A8]|nr:iron-sulfur cluster biosynthesis transcriptional regulator SufR [Symploca sp. SIO2B6]NET47530.1 iron-sulfur cluster biosynthesis transcriptional regulator SufR [Merismopedia sp. SIO2A8]